MTRTTAKPLQPLKGVRILSLALNLPGPAALMRCRQMGAKCLKLEPPSGDPMRLYSQQAYDQLHEGIPLLAANLKTEAGQKVLHRELAKADVLLTSFRPSATEKLGLGWKKLHRLYPTLSHIAIVGSPGARAEEPGHDLTYQAISGLVSSLDLPATLYADMGGSLLATEAVLQALLNQRLRARGNEKVKGVFMEVALSDATDYLALPRQWGVMRPQSLIGGAHAGYRVYPCQDGRVALAALEPHFFAALGAEVGLPASDLNAMLAPASQQAIAAFLLSRTRQELEQLAAAKDIPLHTMA